MTSVFYAVYDAVTTETPFELIGFLKTIYSSRQSVALWYLYSYLALMMMLPLLRKLAKGLVLNEYIYWALMSILFVGIIPILQYRLIQDEVTINSYLKGTLFTTTAIVYFMMGHFFEHVLPEKYYTVKNAVIGLILSVICIAICCCMTDYRMEITGKSTEAFHNSLIAVPTYTIYFSGKLFFMKRQVSQKVQNLICLVGSTTFGIYLLERVLRTETQIIFTTLKPTIGTLPACIIWIAAAFLLGFFVTLILKKIPIIGKYI